MSVCHTGLNVLTCSTRTDTLIEPHLVCGGKFRSPSQLNHGRMPRDRRSTISLCMLGFKLNHVSKRGPWSFSWPRQLTVKTLLLSSASGDWGNFTYHDDVVKWKHFPRCWPFVQGIHQSPVNSLHKGHNGRDNVSNHQPHDCLLSRLFRRRSKKTSKLRATGLCAGNSPGTGEFPPQKGSNTENVSVWWRHHGTAFWYVQKS